MCCGSMTMAVRKWVCCRVTVLGPIFRFFSTHIWKEVENTVYVALQKHIWRSCGPMIMATTKQLRLFVLFHHCHSLNKNLAGILIWKLNFASLHCPPYTVICLLDYGSFLNGWYDPWPIQRCRKFVYNCLRLD